MFNDRTILDDATTTYLRWLGHRKCAAPPIAVFR